MLRKILKYGLIVLLLILLLGAIGEKNNKNGEQAATPAPSGQSEPAKSVTVTAKSRPFYMGFTPWPPDITVAAVNEVYAFIDEHADLISHHFDNGIPWNEALNGTEYPKHLREQWDWRKNKTPAGHKVMVSITPLDFWRKEIAPYWGERGDNQPTPEPWKSMRLNDERVKKAYLAYAKRTAEFFKPQYMAIGVEANILAIKNPSAWNDFLELNAYVYAEMKKAYPNILIFGTIQNEFLKGIEEETKGKSAAQVTAVKEMLKSSDAIGLSTYHYGLGHNPMTPDYFALARSLDPNKPMLLSEFGILSKDTRVYSTTLKGTEEDQKQFLAGLLQSAGEMNFLIVNAFLAIDYDELLAKVPKDVGEAAKIWVHVGLVDTNRREKPALSVWDAYLQLPYLR